MNTTIHLHSPQQATLAIRGLWPEIKAHLTAGKRLQFTVKGEKRTSLQNRRYWGSGVLKQIADQAIVNGKQYSAETWHEQFKRMFIGVVELPNGELVGKSSKELTKAEFADFCSEIEAWACTELGVVFVDLQKE